MAFGRYLNPGAPLGLLPVMLIGGVAALTLFVAPAFAGAQTAGTDRNITAQVRKETPIALPSLAPLVDRVLPAVVNISAQLSNAAAA